MQTLSDIVAAVVVSSSAAAFSHFGVTLETKQVERPPVERTVSRAPAPRAGKTDDRPCPETQAKTQKV